MKSFLSASTFLLPSLALAGYTLQDDYNPSNFFDKFNAYTGTDPTHGFVKFVDMAGGKTSGLMSSSGKSVKLGVDSTNKTPGGRPAVRLESKTSYSNGLIIADIAHMPGSICGVWPAFWTLGPNWPNNGEIDIIEGVNAGTVNAMTLHTAPGCSINSGGFAGVIKTANCDVNAAGQGNNVGCGIGAKGAATYGDPFNQAGGGVYATDWNDKAISIYFFSRNAIPADISAGKPNPANWGTPMAMFAGSCNIAKSFRNHSLVFDTTFCGDWAGASGVWGSDPVCSKKASTCNDYVSNNPADFAEAYWEVNSVKVYQSNGDSVLVSSNPSSAPKGGASSLPSSIPAVPKGSSIPEIPSIVPSGVASDLPPLASPSFAAPVPTVPAVPDVSPGGSLPFPHASRTGRSGRHRPTAVAAVEAAPTIANKAAIPVPNVPKDRGRSSLHSRHFRHFQAHRRQNGHVH